jgi:hypothetical protein
LVPFYISLDRFEGHNRAGLGLFFILMTFSCLNFKKLFLGGKDPSEGILELLPSGGLLECSVPTLAQHKSNESWNRYHPVDIWNAMCQHSHYMGNLLGITTS